MVMRAAADTLTPVVLELGGKDAVIVTEDADLDNVSEPRLRDSKRNKRPMCVCCACVC